MTTETILSFYPLTFVPDPPDVIIGRKDIDSYAAFPEDGAALLKQLQSGLYPDDAAAWYQQQYGEALNIEDFLETLRELQFLRKEAEEERVEAPLPTVFWQRIGQAAFSPLVWVIYILAFGYCTYLLLRFPSLRPGYQHLFFTPYLVVLELGLFLGQFPGIFLHELFHVLAGNRLGLPSRLGIGRRLYILVFETHLTGLWSVSRQKRYLPFLAGMLADLLWFTLLTILASLSYTPTNPYSFPGAFCLALAFSTLLRFAWQFYFYLQTDMYYVFINLFHCVDLQETTRRYLQNCFYRLLGWTHKMQNEEEWHPRDRAVARWYVFFFAAGYLFTLGTLFFVGLPTALRIFTRLVTYLLTHPTFDTAFWDACVFLALNALQFGIVAWIYWHEQQTRIQTRKSTSSTNAASASSQ